MDKKSKYEELIEEVTFEEFKDKIQKGEIDGEGDIDKYVAVNYFSDTVDNQIEFLMDILVENNIAFSVELHPKHFFKKIYVVKTIKLIDTVYVMKDNIVDIGKFKEIYSDNLSLKNFIEVQQQYIEREKSQHNYCPEDLKKSFEMQEELNEIKKKVENGEIIYHDYLKDVGVISEEQHQNITQLIEDIVDKNINKDQLQEKYKNNEINEVDLICISKYLKCKHPEIDKEFNEDV